MRPADAQVDAPRMQALQQFEALSHLQGAVVHEHDATRTHPNGRGGAGDMANEDLRRAARECFGAVMFGHPVTMVAKPLGHLR